MKIRNLLILSVFIVLFCFSFSITAAWQGENTAMNSRIEENWCQNGENRIYGLSYIPEGEGKFPLVIFSHELGNNHESGIRYAERLAENGFAAYVFDFCGGSVSAAFRDIVYRHAKAQPLLCCADALGVARVKYCCTERFPKAHVGVASRASHLLRHVR